jgi:UDP:flavonoid glycosyltransferase YjiC (YdhE family)
VLAALAHGLPLVLLPQGADQFENADACETIGVAEKIVPADLTVERLRAALERVLGDPAFFSAAQTLAAEIAAMPTAEAVAEEIAAQR